MPEVHPQAKLLMPPPPIMQTEENWPLLTVAKSVFDRVGKDTSLAAATALLEDGDGEGWGDEAELDIDESEFNTVVIMFVMTCLWSLDIVFITYMTFGTLKASFLEDFPVLKLNSKVPNGSRSLGYHLCLCLDRYYNGYNYKYIYIYIIHVVVMYMYMYMYMYSSC